MFDEIYEKDRKLRSTKIIIYQMNIIQQII